MCAAIVAAAMLNGLGGNASVQVPLEDWHAQPIGASGVPQGWFELPFPQRAVLRRGTLEIVDDEGQRALRLKTDQTQHTIIRKKIVVDLNATPFIEWRWKVIALPEGADLRVRSRSDSPAVLALAWRSPPRNVSYAWDVTAPIGSRFNNPKQARVHYIIVRSGDVDRGKWLTEQRDIVADYHSIVGEPPPTGPEEMEISVDSNDTRSYSETLIGEIRAVAR